MSDNWVVQALQAAFSTWNNKLSEIWSLVTVTPQEFRGGDIWNAIVGINEGLKAVGYGLLVLFFAMGVFQSAASFRDLQRPEYALRHFIRFIAAKVAVSSTMEIMTVIFSICGGIVQSVMSGVGGMASAGVSIPQEMVDAIENVGFLASIPLWLGCYGSWSCSPSCGQKRTRYATAPAARNGPLPPQWGSRRLLCGWWGGCCKACR